SRGPRDAASRHLGPRVSLLSLPGPPTFPGAGRVPEGPGVLLVARLSRAPIGGAGGAYDQEVPARGPPRPPFPPCPPSVWGGGPLRRPSELAAGRQRTHGASLHPRILRVLARSRRANRPAPRS